MSSFSEFMAHALPIVEADLRTVLSPSPNSPPQFYRILHYHMGWVDRDGNPTHLNTGKRLRPAVCLLVAAAVEGRFEPARPAAAAIELIHNFSLLHDDIQDQSPTRHNRDTVWRIWGNQQAINSGDSLFALAHLAIPWLAPPDLSPELQVGMLTLLDETAVELTRGQHLDISFETRAVVAAEESVDMIGGKTAALISASAEMGALAAGADPAARHQYREFGRNLGIAFQILDDMLDIWGEPEQTGKRAAVDIYQRKKSLPVIFGLEKSQELRERYAAARDFSDEDVQRIIRVLEEVGARRYAEQQAQHYSDQTIRHLEAANPGGAPRSALLELVQQLLHREG
jgi:geranylgeranyl diphosphate synthase, type I